MNDHVGRHDPDWPDDDAARRLRDVLGSEARSIHPSPDGLRQIRERISGRRRSHRAWLRPLAVVAAAAATAVVVVVVVTVVRPTSGQHNNRPIAGSPSPSTSPAPTASVSVSPTPAQTGEHQVTLYYVGKLADPHQLLFSQSVMRPYPASNAFIHDAVDAMLTTAPADPDYTSYWPSGTTIRGISIHGTEAAVDLSSDAAHPGPGGSGLGAISAQQLYYTVHGADPAIDSVELRIDGTAVTSLWGSPITDPIVAMPFNGAFSSVWITSPVNNASVAQSFTFGGDASVYEGTVTWQILMRGDVLKTGFAQASAGAPEQGQWQVSVTLTPGTYEIRAFEASPKDGSAMYVDTKTVTVS